MLIQCQSCATKYRLDPERIPRRKTFVRCKACGTPIYVDPTDDSAEAALPPLSGLIPPPPSLAAHAGGPSLAPVTESGPPSFLRAEPDPDSVPVQCPQCHSRYRVPAAPLRRPNIKLKCSVCGHIFPPVQGAVGAHASAESPVESFPNVVGARGSSSANAQLTDSAIEHVENVAASDPFTPVEPEHNPEQAYLEAVALDQDEGGTTAGKVPDDQKYRLFLKPDQFRPKRTEGERGAPDQPPIPPANAAGSRTESPADSAAAEGPPWSSADDDSILEVEFFDDEEAARAGAATADAIRSAPSRNPPPESIELQEDLDDGQVKPPQGQESFATEEEPLDLPDLDEELDTLEPMDSHEAAAEMAQDMMDLELPAEEPSSHPAPAAREMEVASVPLEAADALEELPDLPELDRDGELEPLPSSNEGLTLDASGTPETVGSGNESFDLDALPAEAFQPPPLPAEPAKEPEPFASMDDLPPLPPLPGEEPTPALEELPPLTDLELPVPTPAPLQEKGAAPSQRLVVPGQKSWFTERRRILFLAVVIGVIAGALLGWGGWLMREKEPETPFTVETVQVHQLSLQDDLEGRTVVHRTGKHLFVVDGQLVNRFPRGEKISWVRVRGAIYGDHAQKQLLGQTQVYLGNVLNDSQLESWDLDAISAYGSVNNGRNNVDVDIPPGAKVPYQLVFVDVRAPVLRTVAQVISYTRDGLAVYVDAAKKK